MPDNKLNGHDHDAKYLQDRAEYTQVGKDLGDIISSLMATPELTDLQQHLLVLTIRKQSNTLPHHLAAMLVQLLAAINHNLRTRPTTPPTK
jgi:hypothetical protein